MENLTCVMCGTVQSLDGTVIKKGMAGEPSAILQENATLKAKVKEYEEKISQVKNQPNNEKQRGLFDFLFTDDEAAN